MSSEKDLVSNSGRFFFARAPRRQSKSPCGSLWRQTVSRRSVSRSRTPLKITKRIQKMSKVDPQIKSRQARKKKAQVKRPSAPHNTNQFLIDVNNRSEEPVNIYPDHDRFTFDFQNHSMAGSMMDFMARLSGQSIETPNNSAESIGKIDMDPINKETCQEERENDLKLEMRRNTILIVII
jgi:hypothetical protein